MKITGRIDVTELPSAYKDPAKVRAEIVQMGLARIVDEITPYGSIMAGDWDQDTPWRKKRDAKTQERVEKKEFEVQHLTLIDGWICIETVENWDGAVMGVKYTSQEQAEASIKEFLDEINSDISNGYRAADEGYGPDEFRVVECKS